MLWRAKNKILCDTCYIADGMFGGDGRPALKSGHCSVCGRLDEGIGASLMTARNWAMHSRAQAAEVIGCTRERVQEWEAGSAMPNGDSLQRILDYVRTFGKPRF